MQAADGHTYALIAHIHSARNLCQKQPKCYLAAVIIGSVQLTGRRRPITLGGVESLPRGSI